MGRHRRPQASILLAFSFFFFIRNSSAVEQALDFTLNATPSKSLDLSGDWQIAKDPDNSGKSAGWFNHGPVKDAVPTHVPNPLEIIFPGYNGVVWYWRTFDGASLAGFDDVRIHLQGADYFAEAWLNGEYLGGNESALLPFAFDAKRALRAGTNQLVVRVIDASYAQEIDGFQLGKVPTGRQNDNPLKQGWVHQNYGGLLLPVTVQAFRRPWIADGFIRPDIQKSKVEIDLLLKGARGPADWKAEVRPIYPQIGNVVVERALRISPDASGRATVSIEIPSARLWQVWDSFLYEIKLSPSAGTVWRERFGMREVSIVKGRIAVNGKRILQRSYLYNQIWPVTLGVPFGEMARRDIELVRQTNANMLRCFSKTPVPATVEAADEVGILLQPETLGSWYLTPGEEQQKKLKNVTERMVLLYRNHPSILWWNILNENDAEEDPSKGELYNRTLIGPYALKVILPAVHELDPTRPALTNDPIWADGPPSVWEPGHSAPSRPTIQDHYYQLTGLEPHDERPTGFSAESWAKIRGRVWGAQPDPNAPYVAITEWGQNSAPLWDRLLGSYKANGVRNDAEDYVVYQAMLEMNRRRYEESGIAAQGFPTFESVQQANRETVAERYREHFALFWGNTHSAGHGMTSLEDSSYEMSGVVDNWRNPKPVVFDAITELNRPLQLNLWVRPGSVYLGDSVTFDVTLVNEALRFKPGKCTLTAKLLDPLNQVVLKKTYEPEISGELIELLKIDSIPLQVRPGHYTLQLELAGGPNNLTASRPLQVFERNPSPLNASSTVWVWEKEGRLRDWLAKRGVVSKAGEITNVRPDDLILISGVQFPKEMLEQIQRAIREGAIAVILQPEAVFSGPMPAKPRWGAIYSDWMPAVTKDWHPILRDIGMWGNPGPGGWGYSRTALALNHPFLRGLPQAVPFETQAAYQRVAPRYTWLLDGKPDDLVVDRAVVEASLHSDRPYSSDLFTVPSGKGKMVLTSLRIAQHLGEDPAADRILENILTTIAGGTGNDAPK